MKKKVVAGITIGLLILVGTMFVQADMNVTGEDSESPHLSVEKHEEFVTNIKNGQSQQDRQATNKQIEQEAVQEQIRHVALIDKAEQRNIQVSTEEAEAEAQEMKAWLAENDNDENAQIARDFVQNFIEKQGMTEEEYWEEYAIKGYKEQLMLNKLQDDVSKNINDPEESNDTWRSFEEQTIKTFKKENAKELNEFQATVLPE